MLSTVLALFIAASPLAVDCPVPSPQHATIQQAEDDSDCSSITLAAQSYAETVEIDRSLSLSGQGKSSTFVDGQIRIKGSGTTVDINSLGLRNGCSEPALQVLSGAFVTPVDIKIEPAALPCPAEVFFDGFESGNTSAWSATVSGN